MESGVKVAIGITLIGVAAIGIRIGMIRHERNAPMKTVATPDYKSNPDDLIYLKAKRQSSMADAKDLVGSKLWVAAGGQMDYYAVAGHHAQFNKKEGTLLGATQLVVKEFFQQVAPKSTIFRIPGGDEQVLLGFTMPQSSSPDTEYAVPVGYRKGKDYSFLIDTIFFYDDPHQLYDHWGPEIWKTVDEHRVIPGMNERQVALSLGQVSTSESHDYGNRTVTYPNLGHPWTVTFVKDKVTGFQPAPAQ